MKRYGLQLPSLFHDCSDIYLSVPHKQIKQLSLSPSRLHFTLMTLHLDLSFVSLPNSLSSLTATGLSFICKYSYVIGEKKGEKKQTAFLPIAK